jgi:hypothetical protein
MSENSEFQLDDILDTFDIVYALLHLLKDKRVTRTHIHVALFLASKRLKRFNKALEFT